MRKAFILPISVAVAALALLATPRPGRARQSDDDIQRVGSHGRIDWTQGSIYATGLGAIPNNEDNDAVAYLKGREYAALDAMKNLLMTIEGVHIDAHSTGRDFVAESTVIRAEVQGLLKSPEFVSERKIRVGRDTMIEVTVATRMYGDHSVASVFLPAEMRQSGAGQNSPEAAEPAIAPVPRPRALGPAQDAGEGYTSVIIDARGYNVARDMSPKIRREDGSEVWGTLNVDPDYVIAHGIVIYAHSIAEARQLGRAGRHPLVIRAAGGSDSPAHADVVLSDRDADRLLRLNSRDGFMNQFHVIFVVDPMN